MIKGIKERVFALVETVSQDDLRTRHFDWFDISIIALIIINTFAVILESVPALSLKYSRWFNLIEIFSVIVFTIEYLLRIWTCTINPEYRKPLSGRLRFILTPLLIIDLIAILPFYLPMLISVDLRFLRTIRLARFLRVLKLGRYSESLKLFGHVLKEKKEELIMAFAMILVLLTISSTSLYYIEHGVQPDKFASIPDAMWWGVATLTTVGYGDIFPITPLGKILGGIIALLGIGLFALPTGIISAGLIEHVRQKGRKAYKCPKCGYVCDDEEQ